MPWGQRSRRRRFASWNSRDIPAEAGGIAADLAERRERVMPIEGGVLDSLCLHRGRVLLEAHREVAALGELSGGNRVALGKQAIADEVEDRALHQRVPRSRVVDGGVHDPPVVVRCAPRRDVRAVHGERGDDLTDGVAKAVEREVPRAPIALRDAVRAMGEHGELARERRLHHQPLTNGEEDRQRCGAAREALVERAKALAVAAVDEEAVQLVQEVVARGAGDRPPFGERFSVAEDLLDHDPRAAGLGREALEIRARVEEPVDVVEAKPVDRSLAEETKHELVRRGEHLRILHAKRGEVVDVEEAAVVDLVERGSPVRETIGLCLEES